MTTVDKVEIENFERVADDWWNETGAFKPLHKLGPTRIKYLRSQLDPHFSCDLNNIKPYSKLSILDIGCGGGLVCEPLARLGAKMTGVDASTKNIEKAITHAAESNLDIEYLPVTAESLVEKKKQYDAVLALEVIEHVADVALFVETCTKLVKPNGLIIFSTLNRTPKSFALGIVAAEYILRWVPAGTHDWKKFLRPSEIAAQLRRHQYIPSDITGMTYNPINDKFSLSKDDLAVNYFLTAVRQK
ncbi:MAG: bifunctional 3-demethylubiquinol 3-O-methyltransferase/2-polyprenyl-6-hydroxyphenol methylase [Micavibrio sp.]|nr:bifunctional 3-demethylubiquinol 3-O-methyltransferase/2-polyprenyl-6-hydroxyphenol methylase [Micavibrio sp.]